MSAKKQIRPVIVLLQVLAFISFFTVGNAQKVALVLSGGGSKGAAHIGVIRALEENHIPINYIVGTSIGAIIGSLYAMGYTTDEMDALINSEEFIRMATVNMDEKYVYYFRKEDPNASWINLDFNFKKKFTAQLPANIISPYEMDFRFMEIMAPASAACNYDFNKLMIPFRCVVADVDSTTALVMRKGDISSAVRGSMTIPFVYRPITINGKLVFDGGMYDNFPADVALREFHPQVIIGSRVAVRYDAPDRDDALSQLQSMLMERQTDTITYPNSVLILPSVPQPNIIDFSKSKELIDSGYQAALRRIPDIRKLVHDSMPAEQLARKRKEFRDRQPPLIFDSISAQGLNSVQEDYIRKTLTHGKEHVTAEDMKLDYFRFIDQGFVRGIYPIAVYNPRTGYYRLFLDIQKSNNFNVQFGGNLSLSNINEGFLEIGYRYLWTKALNFLANGYFGKFYNSVRTCARIDFNSKTPWFLDASYTYNHFDYFGNSTYFFDDKTPTYIIQTEYFGLIRGGLPVTSSGKLVLGFTSAFTNSKYYQFNNFSRVDTADQTSFNFLSPRLSFELNNMNRKQYPGAGARFTVEGAYVYGTEGYLPGSTSIDRQENHETHKWIQLRMLWDNYFESIGPLKLGFYGEGLISDQGLFSNYTSSILYAPAFTPLPEMQSVFLPAFHANSYVAAGIKTVLKVYKKIDFRLEGYVFQPYKAIEANQETQQAYYSKIFHVRAYLATAALVYNSFVGPLSLGVNYYDKSTYPFVINFNFGYIIFNRRALP
jgi:NTE family protein